MLTVSYAVNLLVLIPLLLAFATLPDRMDVVFGPVTDARQILVCLYATIAAASLFGLALIIAGQVPMAAQIGLTLFTLQIAYKLMTVPMVGLHSPVVITNLAVVFVHGITLWTLLRS